MEIDAISPDEEAVDLALQRDAEIEAGIVVPLSHQEVMQLLRAGMDRK